MKLSSTLIAAVSVNLAAAAVHKGPRPRAHHHVVEGMSIVDEVHHKGSKGKKHHKGNGGKHDSGVDGHHPGYVMSVAKASKAKAHKSTKTLSHPVKKESSSRSEDVEDHSLPLHSGSKAAKRTVSSEPIITSTVATSTPVAVAPEEETLPMDVPIPEDLFTTPEGTDTSILKVIGKEETVNVVKTTGTTSNQSKVVRDETSANLQGKEQASLLSENTKSSSSLVHSPGLVASGACLLAAAFYLVV